MTRKDEWDFSFSMPGLARDAHRRDDKAWLNETQGLATSRFYLFVGEQIVVHETHGHLQAHVSAAIAQQCGYGRDQAIFLGTHLKDGSPTFAARVGTLAKEHAGTESAHGHGTIFVEGLAHVRLADLRALAIAAELSPLDLNALATAKALFSWHRSHRFCAQCGEPSVVSEAGWRRDCSACGAMHFPRTDPCVIMLITYQDNCLLGNHSRLTNNVWTTLAGFMEPGETIEEAVRREIHEEVGLNVGSVTYGASQPWPFSTNLMTGCFGEALGSAITIDRDELDDARWFSRQEVAQMAAGTHPQGLLIAPRLSIAHWLIKQWQGPLV